MSHSIPGRWSSVSSSAKPRINNKGRAQKRNSRAKRRTNDAKLIIHSGHVFLVVFFFVSPFVRSFFAYDTTLTNVTKVAPTSSDYWHWMGHFPEETNGSVCWLCGGNKKISIQPSITVAHTHTHGRSTLISQHRKLCLMLIEGWNRFSVTAKPQHSCAKIRGKEKIHALPNPFERQQCAMSHQEEVISVFFSFLVWCISCTQNGSIKWR